MEYQGGSFRNELYEFYIGIDKFLAMWFFKIARNLAISIVS